MAKTPERPEGHPPQAVWPPRVPFNSDPVTYAGGGVVREDAENGTPKISGGVRITRLPIDGATPRSPLADIPTDGPGVPRRAIPAPEEAGTTGTIPAPQVMSIGDGTREVAPRPTTTTVVPAAQAAAPASTPANTRAAKAAAKAAKGTRKA
jgi:hypothetical protein